MVVIYMFSLLFWNQESKFYAINYLMNSETPVAKIARFISESSRAIAFTGAGISTESGIFRIFFRTRMPAGAIGS